MPRLEAFVANIVRSGLLDRDSVETARAALPVGPDFDAAVRLARLLIQQGALTSYQARKLLAGATRGFFLGNYRILRALGEGGMGKVYLAGHREDGHRVAIKVLPPGRAKDGGQALLRFRREMDLSRRAFHPNLARALDVGQDGDVHFMILEYVPGESLYQLVKQKHGGPLRVPDAARYFLKVIDGLEAAHHAGLVHRDIKPSNLMVTPDGDARVLDLGLARAIDEDRPLTHEHVLIGTLDYASPEQLGNAAAADRRSDLYSVGCTLYFSLAGRPPFDGGDVVNKVFKQKMEEAEPLERVARGVPSAFAAIVRKLMAKDPDDRHQTCAELRHDLARWADPAVVHAILGAEADAARAFRPPPPEIDDDELRSLADAASEGPGPSLRDFGPPEPAPAPYRRLPPPPRKAVVLPPPASRPTEAGDEMRWLIRFVAITLILGAVLVIVLAVIQLRS